MFTHVVIDTLYHAVEHTEAMDLRDSTAVAEEGMPPASLTRMAVAVFGQGSSRVRIILLLDTYATSRVDWRISQVCLRLRTLGLLRMEHPVIWGPEI